jgi:hypothetical protein
MSVEDTRDRVDQQRLGQSGHPHDQAVAAHEQREQHLLDHRLLADDALAQLHGDLAAHLPQPLRKGQLIVLR